MAAGAVVLAIVFRDGLLRAVRQAVSVGWSILWLFPLFALTSMAAVMAWRVFIEATPRPSVPSVLRLLAVRTEALALNLVLPAAGLSGDVLRSSLTRSGGHQTSAPPVILDRVASAAAELLTSVAGLAVYAVVIRAMHAGVGAGMVLGTLMLGLLLSTWRKAAGLIERIPTVGRRESVRGVISALQDRAYRPTLARSVGWHLVERFFMVAEVWLIARLLGTVISPAEALFTAPVTTFFSLALFFMPAQLGAFEAGLAYAFNLLGLPAATGLAVALIRRARQVGVAAIGLGLLLVERGRARAR